MCINSWKTVLNVTQMFDVEMSYETVHELQNKLYCNMKPVGKLAYNNNKTRNNCGSFLVVGLLEKCIL